MGGMTGVTTAMGGDTAMTSMGGGAGTTSTSTAGGTGGVIGTTEGDWYVAVDGSDDNPGTEAEPFATLGRAQQAASPGDTVLVRGGVYAFSSGTVGVAFTKAGTADNPIRYFAYAGETPIFDLSGINNPSGRVTGFDITANYIHIRGMEVTGVPQYQGGQDSWGVRIRGNGNVLELLNVHHNEAPGIFITSGSDNLILNCDSHHNYDVLENGGSGDGFGCHSTGAGNVIRGCRGYDNSDDGFDFINAPGACTVEDSWAFRNGYVPDTNTAAGNGAGFKAGGYGLDPGDFPAQIPRHVVKRCVAWGNRSQGFYANHHPGAIDCFRQRIAQLRHARRRRIGHPFVAQQHRLRRWRRPLQLHQRRRAEQLVERRSQPLRDRLRESLRRGHRRSAQAGWLATRRGLHAPCAG